MKDQPRSHRPFFTAVLLANKDLHIVSIKVHDRLPPLDVKWVLHLENMATSAQTRYTLIMIGTQPHPTPSHAAENNRLVTEQYEPATAELFTH